MMRQTSLRNDLKIVVHPFVLSHILEVQIIFFSRATLLWNISTGCQYWYVYGTIRANYKKLPFLLLGKDGHFFIDPQKLNKEENLQQFSFRGLNSVIQSVTHTHRHKHSYFLSRAELFTGRKVFGSDMVLKQRGTKPSKIPVETGDCHIYFTAL